MIAKNKKGKSFGGCVRYVLNERHEILEAEGVLAEDATSIICDFAIQRSGRPEIKQPVGHIAVSFSPEDSGRMSNDFMLQLAHEYMEVMDIRIDYPNCAVSFQLIPVTYSEEEAGVVDMNAQMLDKLSKGVEDQSIGNISFVKAEKHAETYKYYSGSKDKAMFAFNALVYGTPNESNALATRILIQLNNGNELRTISLSPDDVRKDDNFYPLPWAVHEVILGSDRNPSVWNAGQNMNAFYHLPYIITAEEASEFFRLPVGSDAVSAGLNVNEAGKTNRTYADNVVGGGDITVGTLKSSSRGDTIGLSLKDLTKHMLIVGTPGSGKTTFSVGLLDRLWKEHRIPFLVIEPAKNEYRALVQSIPDLQVFTPGKNFISPFVFNPFVPPRNVKLETYKSTLKTAFAAAVSMSAPLDKIFEETVNNCYSDFRWLDTYRQPFNRIQFFIEFYQII